MSGRAGASEAQDGRSKELMANIASRSDDALQIVAGWYLDLRDWHFGRYWRELVDPERGAPLATASSQHGQDREAWERVVLRTAVRDFRILLLIVVPIAIPVGALFMWLMTPDDPDAVSTGLVMGPTLAALVGGWLQLRRFRRALRRPEGPGTPTGSA
jgi:hypothetical protein